MGGRTSGLCLSAPPATPESPRLPDSIYAALDAIGDNPMEESNGVIRHRYAPQLPPYLCHAA
ncbi:MAG: hypothetical protein ACLTGT_00300 [Oscillospiraceae bacterium]